MRKLMALALMFLVGFGCLTYALSLDDALALFQGSDIMVPYSEEDSWKRRSTPSKRRSGFLMGSTRRMKTRSVRLPLIRPIRTSLTSYPRPITP